jgi:hypothetical protein
MYVRVWRRVRRVFEKRVLGRIGMFGPKRKEVMNFTLCTPY